jgi:Fic family protein
MSAMTEGCGNATVKEKLLNVMRQFQVQNIEQISRVTRVSRVTATKYLDQLLAEGKVKEIRIGNNRLFQVS